MGVDVTVSDWADAPVRLPAGRREFAIGDVHGMSGHLGAMLAAMGKASGGAGHLTLLGDLFDRGPDSLGCYRLALGRIPAEMGFSGRTGLLGNHEIFPLSVIGGDLQAKEALSLWLVNGGVAVLEELGLGLDRDPCAVSSDEVALALRSALDDRILAEIAASASHREQGNLLFVHAGVNPEMPLALCFAKPCLWLRDEDHYAWVRFPFFGHEGVFEGNRVVVHGHTPEHSIRGWKGLGREPGIHRLDGWRIGLDGGSYETGIVAGAEFRNGAYRVYLAR